jgi:hypothetical protein
LNISNPSNPLISDFCSDIIEITPEEKTQIDYIYALIAQDSVYSFQMIVSVLVVLYAAIMIVMLQRTQDLGELIMMVG